MSEARVDSSTSSYVQCAVCGFAVKTEQASCPNCGVVEPSNTALWEGFGRSPVLDLLNVAGVSALLIVLGSRIMQALTTSLVELTQWGISGMGIRIMSGVAIAGALTWYHRRRFKRRRTDCFQQIAASLQDRLDVPLPLKETEQQLNSRIRELEQQGQDIEDLKNVLGTVQQAITVAEQQARQARLIRRRIDMLRWQNQLEPLIVAPPDSTDVANWQERHKRLEGIRAEGQALSQELMEQGDLLAIEEGAQLRKTWADLLAGCERLKNEALTRQALAAVESVRPLTQPLPSPPSSTDTTDALQNALVTHDFGDLNQAVKELRREEVRLKAEREQVEQMARAATRLRG